jgi:hypothetical protein
MKWVREVGLPVVGIRTLDMASVWVSDPALMEEIWTKGLNNYRYEKELLKEEREGTFVLERDGKYGTKEGEAGRR